MLFDSDNERLTINSFQWLSEAGVPSYIGASGSGSGGGSNNSDKTLEINPWLLILLIAGGVITLIAIVIIISKQQKKKR
ncbi:MAG: hypothetical protein ACFFAO_10880 [Candidatus Hermodarchaeota archaeon]